MEKIILFNGPPSSGKDTAANIVFNRLLGKVSKYKMAAPLKLGCAKLLGINGDLDDLETIKEENLKFKVKESFVASNEYLRKPLVINTTEDGKCYISFRQFLIHISENVMKPLFGNQIFGKIAVENLKQADSDFVVISDSGFFSEVNPLIEHFGKEKIILEKIYRPGTDFSKDSRSYLDLPNVGTFTVQNDGNLEELERKLIKILDLNDIKTKEQE